jgi:hypothetical protein
MSGAGDLTPNQAITPPVGSGGPVQRISPKPRVSSPVTTADPVLTRLALGRSNDGSQFGMFLQIFADGTVIDSEGVHHARAADLKPVFDTIQSGDLYRMRGHCGAPSTDFIEYVHVVVYERRLGRLMAHAFSYSGNVQGCDHAIRHLHTVLENLQAKLSRQPIAGDSGKGASFAPVSPSTPPPPNWGGSTSSPGERLPASSPRSSRQPAAPAVNPGAPIPTGPVIPLTPADSSP